MPRARSAIKAPLRPAPSLLRAQPTGSAFALRHPARPEPVPRRQLGSRLLPATFSSFAPTVARTFLRHPLSFTTRSISGMSAAAGRVGQITGHLASASQGLLKDQVAIITGAAQGIGKSIAILFAKEGAKVVVVDLDATKAESVVKEIEALGGKAIAVQADVTAEDFPKKVVKSTVDAFGDIHHIVNNAGFTFDKMIHTMSDETFDLILNVHNRAPFRLVREAAPYFRTKDPEKQKQNRSIVNVSSVSGLHGNTGQINYAIAKAGVVGMTKTIAKEWGVFGVRCNTVAFGYIETRLTAAKEAGATVEVNGQKIALGIPGGFGGGNKGPAGRIPDIPLGRPGTADEAAAPVLFLASPLAAYISGHTLEVTGGRGI